MIVETIVSTLDESGTPNFAPMGVLLGEGSITLRPFRNTRTYHNLIAGGYGVANFTDNALAYVQCGLYHATLPHFPANTVPGVVYQETCSWQEFLVASHGGGDERAELQCRVLYAARQRDFLGFCRARNAVIEATILATRLEFIDPGIIDSRMLQFREIIDKTGDGPEKEACRLIQEFVRERRSK